MGIQNLHKYVKLSLSHMEVNQSWDCNKRFYKQESWIGTKADNAICKHLESGWKVVEKGKGEWVSIGGVFQDSGNAGW